MGYGRTSGPRALSAGERGSPEWLLEIEDIIAERIGMTGTDCQGSLVWWVWSGDGGMERTRTPQGQQDLRALYPRQVHRLAI